MVDGAHRRMNVDVLGGGPEAGLDGASGLVVSDGGEEVDLGFTPAELGEGEAAASAGEEACITQMKDVAGHRSAVDASQGHVLDVADDGDARCCHVVARYT